MKSESPARFSIFVVCISIVLSCNIIVFSKQKTQKLNKPFSGSTILNLYQGRIAWFIHYDFGANSRVDWTIDEHLFESNNFYTTNPTAQCPSFMPVCDSPQYVTLDLSRYCDGDTHQLSARVVIGNSTIINVTYNDGFGVGQYGGKFSCTDGGSSVPALTQRPIILCRELWEA